MAYSKSAVNIDNRHTRTSRIKLVGVELEGAWKAPPEGVKVVDHINPGPNELGRDGSLRAFRDRIGDKLPYVGELPSPPLEESAIDAWIEKHYPQDVSAECGLHVHISMTDPLVYMRLMDDEAYPATVVEYIKKWAEREKVPTDDPIWDRLAGKCVYCQHIHWPSEQIKNVTKDYEKTRKGHRYTAIAFHFNRDGLGTIECRLLSMPKDVEQAKRAVKEFISITNRYLVATAKRERKQVAQVVVDSPIYEMTMSSTV